jgi:hypothetical protein
MNALLADARVLREFMCIVDMEERRDAFAGPPIDGDAVMLTLAICIFALTDGLLMEGLPGAIRTTAPPPEPPVPRPDDEPVDGITNT